MDLENVASIGNEEELKNYLQGNADSDDDDGGKGADNGGKNKQQKQTPPELDPADELASILGAQKAGGAKGKAAQAAGDEEEEEEEEDDSIHLGDEDDDDDESYDPSKETTIEYLNRKANLNLNLEKLPKDMDVKTERKLIYGLLDRIVNNAKNRIDGFAEVKKLMDDPEIKLVLDAKKSGKGLKDIAPAYVTSSAAKTDEQLVMDDYKKKYPTLSDTEITDLTEEAKKKGLVTKLAAAIREEDRKATETRAAREQQEKADADKNEALAYKENVANFANFVQKVKTIGGVEFTDEMKREAFRFATVRDENKETALDRALQSDDGVLLASIGIKLLTKMLKSTGTNSLNKGKKSIMDTLDLSVESTQRGQSRKNSVNENLMHELANLM